MPAGEIARHALPGKSAREQSAGATLAGRVPTMTEGGAGGMPPSVRGGGGEGARVTEGRTTCPCDPVSSPAAGGGRAHLCNTEAGWGAGWRDHLSGDLWGPDSPCFKPPLPRDRGGATSCQKVLQGGGRGGDYVWYIPCAGAPQLRKGRSARLRWYAACSYAGALCGTA